MSKELTKRKLPSLSDLIVMDDQAFKDNQLTVLLNQEPKKEWIMEHPISKIPYIPIARIEFLLTAIYGKWWVEIKNTQIIANSVVVTVRLYVINPITNKEEWQDGIGASPIQTDKGSGATDWNHVKSNSIQLAAPAAETYAIKDSAEKWGKLFGKDLTRKDMISYDALLKAEPITDSEKRKKSESDRISSFIKECKTVAELEMVRGEIKDEHTELFAEKYEQLNK